jgi:hypothetical protein
MWALENRTRFVADRSFARDRDGAEVLLVAVKATFDIGHDHAPRLSARQPPLVRVPRHRGDPARTSLLHESDFALSKKAADIIVLGQAHARDGVPTIASEVRVRVGDWQKRLLVLGDRRWIKSFRGFRLSEPQPFVTMPLDYEHAFGGQGHRENPVGVGAISDSGGLEATLVPNLEDPEDLLTSPEQDKRAVSLGPIARDWPARRALAGTYDERWRRERHPLVPDDFDDDFWQCAPVDQRAVIRGGEPVELVGLSPRGPLRFELPRLRLSFRTRIGKTVAVHAPSIHSLVFEPDEGRMALVYQSSLACHHDIQVLERTIIEELGAEEEAA